MMKYIFYKGMQMKNFKVFLILAVCFGLNAVYASESTEAHLSFSKEEVQEKLGNIGLSYFMEKTDIVNSLEGPKVALGVAMAVELAYADYYEYTQKGMPAQMFRMNQIQMEMHKPLIYETLLKEYPSALAELQQHGMYKPR